MSYLGIILSSVFSANVLLVYGLGICPVFRREGRGAFIQLLALALVNVLASVLFWLVRTFVLLPLSLQAIDVIVYAVVIAPVLKYFSRFIASSGTVALVKIGAAADEAVTNCLVFGVALIVSRGNYTLPEALVASLCSCLGYWMAVVLLESIRDRLELSRLPEAFKGPPSLLISAGLIAMAFMGLDEVLVRNLVR